MVKCIVGKKGGGIPYTAHGAQIAPPPPLIFDLVYFCFVFMLILG